MHKQSKPKAHGRSIVTYEQGKYIAAYLKWEITQGLIQSRKDQQIAFLKYANQFVEEEGEGKFVQKIPSTTLYNFLEKHKIPPYTKFLSGKQKNLTYNHEDHQLNNDDSSNHCSTEVVVIPTQYNEGSLYGNQSNSGKTTEIQEQIQYSQQKEYSCVYQNKYEEYQQEYYHQDQCTNGSWDQESFDEKNKSEINNPHYMENQTNYYFTNHFTYDFSGFNS